MIRLKETQLGLDKEGLDTLFSYACGASSSVVTFKHPGARHQDNEFTHAMVRHADSFEVSLLHAPDVVAGIDELSEDLAGSLIGRWISNQMIEPVANQAEREYV